MDEKGHITALAPGEALITARAKRFKVSCLVTVRVPMEGIAIQEEGGQLVRGTEMQLTPVFFPEDTNDDKSVEWESSDESVLKVTQEGLVQAVAAGEAEIAQEVGISRQAAHEALTRAASKLTEMEAALGVAGRFRRMESGLEEALSLLRNRDYSRAEKVLTELLDEETEDPHGI